jgi:hypothetical protein
LAAAGIVFDAAPLSTPARRKPRLGEPLPTARDEADRETARETALPDISVHILLPLTEGEKARTSTRREQ